MTRVANLRGTGTGPRLNGTFFLTTAPGVGNVFHIGTDVVFKLASDVNVDQMTEIARMEKMLDELNPRED